MDKKKESYLNVALSVLIMIFAVYITSAIGKRIKVDITSERLYTLSKGSKAILKKLDTPMSLKLYYSKTAANKGTEGIRAFNNYYLYIKDLLDEFTTHSRNNLTLEVIDPRPDTSDEEDAISSGLKRFPLTETEKYFFGLVIRSENGTEKVIEFFDPNMQENVEYDITKLIYSATNPKKKVVGVLSSLKILAKEMSPYMAQMMRMQGKQVEESWLISKMMNEFYEVKEIDKSVDEITALDILLVIHPKNFPEKLLFAIDQYLMKGGKMMIMVDPLAIAEQATASPAMGKQPDFSSNFAPFFESWGVKYQIGEFAGDKYLSGIRRINQFAPPSRLLPLIECDHRCSEISKDIISNGINKLTMIYPGALDFIQMKNPNLVATPVITTTDKGNTYKAQGYELNNPPALLNKFTEGNKPVVMGYKIKGKFKSAFPQGITIIEKEDTGADAKTKGKKGKEQKITGIIESQKESAVIIFSDIDFIHDQNAFRQTMFGVAAINDNSKLFLNAVENLSGSTDLMSIRSKGKFSRSFDVIDAIEFEAEKNTQAKVNQINGQIKRFSSELNQLGRSGESVALIKNEGIKKKKALSKKIVELKRELREVKRMGREKVEGIGIMLQYLNTIMVPLILLIIGIYIAYSNKRRLKINKN